MRMVRCIWVLCSLIFLSEAIAQHHQRNESPIETIKLNENIFMLRGTGGNIGVVKGKHHIILIDSQFARMSDHVKTAVKGISSLPVGFLINTHYHNDHSGGNAHFTQHGVTVIAHENTRKILAAKRDKKLPNPRLPALTEGSLPYMTVKAGFTLHEEFEDIEIVHFPNGHTGGDLAVFFKQSNVIHTGDMYFVGVTPFIDVPNGGSYQGYLKAMEAILARADDNTQIIPGHGPMANKAMMQKDYERLKEFDPTSLD